VKVPCCSGRETIIFPRRVCFACGAANRFDGSLFVASFVSTRRDVGQAELPQVIALALAHGGGVAVVVVAAQV
jgi:hypothetical protein